MQYAWSWASSLELSRPYGEIQGARPALGRAMRSFEQYMGESRASLQDLHVLIMLEVLQNLYHGGSYKEHMPPRRPLRPRPHFQHGEKLLSKTTQPPTSTPKLIRLRTLPIV